jgi:hypothetical protein
VLPFFKWREADNSLLVYEQELFTAELLIGNGYHILSTIL